MQTNLSRFTAVIGIDWADKKHDVCVQDMATGRRRVSQVRHRAEDLDKWAPTLYRRYSGPIAVALELSKGPIVSVLQKYDFFVLYLIDPSTLAYRRKTFTPSGAKDDPTDAECALKLLLRTHLRSVSAVHPIFSAMDCIAAHLDGCDDSCSWSIRTALSRTSGEYLFGLAIGVSSQHKRSPANPG